MIASWAAQAPAIVAALLLFVAPGFAVGWFLRLRGTLLVAVSTGVSFAVIALASIVAPMVGMSWSLVPVTIVACVVAVVAFVLRARSQPPQTTHSTVSGPWGWGAVAVTALATFAIVCRGIGDAASPTQLYDGTFHLNAVEFIAKTGDASPFHMTMVLPGQATSFYPTLWHAVVALIVPFTGSIVIATNVVTAVAIAALWPLGVSTLAAVLFPHARTAGVWAPLTSFAFSLFPLGFLNWGVLYPNLLGMLLVPIFIAVVVTASAGVAGWRQQALWVMSAVAVMGAVALGHPSALFGALALLLPFLVWRAWRIVVDRSILTRVITGVGVAAIITGFAVLWVNSNVTTNEWLPIAGLGQTLSDIVMLNPVWRGMGYLLGPLVLLGMLRVIRTRLWWVLASYGIAMCLYVVAAWLRVLPLRSMIVGLWYDDTTRVAALLSILALPLAGLGAATLWELIVRNWTGPRRFVSAAAGVAVIALAFTHLNALRAEVQFMRDVSFANSNEAQGLSPDEEQLFEDIVDELPDDALVIGDPLTGASLLYAYTGVDVVFPHVTGRYGPDAEYLARHLASGSPEVCSAAQNLGVNYALDFGDRVLFENHYTTYDGLHDLADSPILTERARVGDAALFEITGCG